MEGCIQKKRLEIYRQEKRIAKRHIYHIIKVKNDQFEKGMNLDLSWNTKLF